MKWPTKAAVAVAILVMEHLFFEYAAMYIQRFGIGVVGTEHEITLAHGNLKMGAACFALGNAGFISVSMWASLAFEGGKTSSKTREALFWLFMVHANSAMAYVCMASYGNNAVLLAPNGRPVHAFRHISWCTSNSLIRMFLGRLLSPVSRVVISLFLYPINPDNNRIKI